MVSLVLVDLMLVAASLDKELIGLVYRLLIRHQILEGNLDLQMELVV